MSDYIFAPAGPVQLRSSLLKKMIEIIGKQQPGFGSAMAKGKRYIKKELVCSGTAIKRACNVYNKKRNHDFEEYGTEVYYYHKEYCTDIVKFVLDYIVENKKKIKLSKESLGSEDFKQLLNLAYEHRITQLEWVSIQNYKNQGDCAELLYKEFELLCK